MPFIVEMQPRTAAKSDLWEPCCDGRLFDTGKEAAQVKDELTAQHGASFRYRIKPIVDRNADPDAWRRREQAHFDAGRYVPVPWHDCDWNDELRWEHFAHMSLKQPGMVAFTETPEKGQADRQTIIAPGRYLQRYFSDDLDANAIEYWAARMNVEAGTCELHVTQDGDEIVQVYSNGPDSCMKGDDGDWDGPVHPCRVYAGPDLALAYIGSLDDPSGRCVVWPEKKRYGRIYGDCSMMRLLLESEGYSSGSLDGARIRKIHAYGDNYVMPYVDGPAAYDAGDYFVLSDGGDIFTGSTSGTVEVVERIECERCGGDYRERDTCAVLTPDGEETWCRDCRRNHATRCEHDQEYWSDQDTTFHDVYYLGALGRVVSDNIAEPNLEDYGAVWSDEADAYVKAELVELADAIQEIARALQVQDAHSDPRQLSLPVNAELAA